jgi:hypothetical protein
VESECTLKSSDQHINLQLRLLLHTEVADGAVVPVWEEARPSDIAALKEVMASRRRIDDDADLHYMRVPITAEHSPDFSDFSELIAIALATDMAYTPIIVNDQLGRGRSTLTSIILVLIQKWLAGAGTRTAPTTPGAVGRAFSLMAIPSIDNAGMNEAPIRRQSYQVINSACNPC